MCELIISSLSLLCVYACMYTYECKHVFILTCEYCVNMYVCVYVCIFIYMGAYTLLYVCVHVYLCAREGIWMYVCDFMCAWLHSTTIMDSSCDPNSVMRDLDLCSLWTQHTGDSKTGPWDDPKISIGSCSKDQITIQIQNCVISCECLLLYLSLLSLSVLFICYLYHFIWPSDIFDQYDYPYHFTWHQWQYTLCI